MAKRFSLDGISVLSNSQPTNCNLDDINRLLYLETLQRFKENEMNLRLQAEEKTRLYEDARAEYRYYYELFALILQTAATRATFEHDEKIGEEELDQLKSDLTTINRNVNNDESVGYFTPEMIEKCKQTIRALKTYDDITNIKEETSNIKGAIEAIQSLNYSIEKKLESVTTRSIDFYVEQLQSKSLGDHKKQMGE